MKHILLAYALISLFLISILSVLSYGYGSSYVYLFWRNWQLQTNIWVLLAGLALISFLIQLFWLGLKRYLTREQRKQRSVFEFKNLHPYEQLAVIWLLDAAQDKHKFIQTIFAESGLLKGVIDSRLYWMQKQYSEALVLLNDTNAMAFELAEIQRIEIFLSQQDGEKALTHLEFLNQHELSPWLTDVKNTFEQRILNLWGQFSSQFPWLYLRSTKYGHLDDQAKKNWLKQLLKAFDHATVEDFEFLKQRYLDLSEQIFSRSYEVKLLWLKILARLPDMSEYHESLVLHLLNEQFNQEAFYLWFQQQLLRQSPDYSAIEKQIVHWEEKYPSLPILSFAKWHILEATQRHLEAEQLLNLYPDDVLMGYLRIKSQLHGHDELIKQLNLIFENNANFVEIKI